MRGAGGLNDATKELRPTQRSLKSVSVPGGARARTPAKGDVMDTFLMFVAAQALLAQAPAAGTDAQAAETQATYSFRCANIRAQLGFEERSDATPRAALADRLRIVLTRFEVEGRTIAPADRGRIEAAFNLYAWLTRLRGTCSGSGNRFELTVEGMDAAAWAAAVSPWRGRRPQQRLTTVVVAEDGGVTIR